MREIPHLRSAVKYFLLFQVILACIILSGYIVIVFIDSDLAALLIPQFVIALLIVPALLSFVFQRIFKLSVNSMIRLGLINVATGFLVTIIIMITEFSIGKLVIDSVIPPLILIIGISLFLFLTFMFGAAMSFGYQVIVNKLETYFKAK